MKEVLIVKVEPSKRLSELAGFPLFIERRFPVGELLKDGVIDEDDFKRLQEGEEIQKSMKVARRDE